MEQNLEPIRNKIYEIRGQRVMLDIDLATAYGVETSQLKRQVRRNMERFEGDDFMFELTHDELSRCQFGTLNNKRGQNFKYLPFAFTELGVAMLSSVLRSKTAIDTPSPFIRKIGTRKSRKGKTVLALASDFVDNSTGSHDVKERFLVSGLPF